MKKLKPIDYMILLLICYAVLINVGCAKKSDSSPVAGACAAHPIVGTWRNLQAAAITFNEDCSGSMPVCGATFTYPYSAASTGSAIVTAVSSNSNPGCITTGTNSCAYQISGNQLTLNCNNIGNSTFTKY